MGAKVWPFGDIMVNETCIVFDYIMLSDFVETNPSELSQQKVDTER